MEKKPATTKEKVVIFICMLFVVGCILVMANDAAKAFKVE